MRAFVPTFLRENPAARTRRDKPPANRPAADPCISQTAFVRLRVQSDRPYAIKTRKSELLLILFRPRVQDGEKYRLHLQNVRLHGWAEALPLLMQVANASRHSRDIGGNNELFKFLDDVLS